MKAAIGNSLLMGIIVTFVTIVLFILLSSLVYTKAFRVKNRIVDVIEKYETYDACVQGVPSAECEITKLLGEIGYKANAYSNNTRCNNYSGGAELENPSSPYHYCVFRLNSGKNNGYYYKVVAFAYLDFPLISSIQIPVSGETKIFYSNKTS